MGQIKIGSNTFNDVISDCGTTDSVYLIEPLGNSPTESAPMYEESHITYPGEDGMGIKRFGMRGRIITCEIGFMGLTKTACETAKNDFHASVTGLASFVITIPGGTARNYCRLQGCQPIGWQQYGLDIMMLKMRYEFLQVRENS